MISLNVDHHATNPGFGTVNLVNGGRLHYIYPPPPAPASACEADVGVVFTEKDDGTIDVSMRSIPGIDISSVAMRLGGGGHPQAAGCNLSNSLTEARERVLAELKRSLLEQTARNKS